LRPIPLDDAAHLIVNGGNVVHRLELLSDHVEFFGAGRSAKHKFDRHGI
jgi:hypothetical protein